MICPTWLSNTCVTDRQDPERQGLSFKWGGSWQMMKWAGPFRGQCGQWGQGDRETWLPSEGGGDSMSRGVGWEGVDGRKWCSLVSPRGLSFMTPLFFKRLCFVPCHQSLPSVSRLAGPLCPGAATPPPSSSPPRRTRPWGQSSSMRWTPAASTTSTRRSSACFPRCYFGQGSLGGPWSQSSLTLCGHAHAVWHYSAVPSAHSGPGPGWPFS